MTTARMEVVVKFSTVPADAQFADGRATFTVLAADREVGVSLKSKAFAKLVEAERAWPSRWVCSVTGKIGAARGNGFLLEEPVVQVFERQPKPAAAASPSATAPAFEAKPTEPTAPAPLPASSPIVRGSSTKKSGRREPEIIVRRARATTADRP